MLFGMLLVLHSDCTGGKISMASSSLRSISSAGGESTGAVSSRLSVRGLSSCAYLVRTSDI